MTDDTNPKDLVGREKVSFSKVPAIAMAWCAAAMMDGARKYGAYNWRTKAVQPGIYIDAAKRHMDLWFEGQQRAPDSGVHHLGHAMACMAILIDAESSGKLTASGQNNASLLEGVLDYIQMLKLDTGDQPPK